MAVDSLHNHPRVSRCFLAFLLLVFGCSLIEARPCRMQDFGYYPSACNVNKTRSIVFFMRTKCNITEKGSYFPQPIENLPCVCEPGHGIEVIRTPSYTWKCSHCKAGTYSIGGLLIDSWERWNGSMQVPGSGYMFTPFCTNIANGRSCNGWQPSDDFSHLVSSKFVNATNPASCYHKKSMQTYMIFDSEIEGKNSISFRYKVDGMPCPKRLSSRSTCRKGLRFFVDNKEVLHADSQFTWRVFKYNLTSGTHLFRWTHESSCTVRDGNLDVAYVTHVGYVGGRSSTTRCSECPTGSFSNKEQSQECAKCPYGQYQDKKGQTSCKKCPEGHFSHEADKGCFPLRACNESDYRVVPDPVSKCFKEGSKIVRKQTSAIPHWPGMSTGICIPNSVAVPKENVPCTCEPGYRLITYHSKSGPDKYECSPCPIGLVSSGNTSTCSSCSAGRAAIPGLFFTLWPNGPLPKQFKTECAGAGCGKGPGWVSAGDSLATKRIPGNFETYIGLENLEIKYYRSYIAFKCSVDCRINPATNKFASTQDCQLRFSIRTQNSVVVRETDCIKYRRDHLRNGTEMNHIFMIVRPGNYTLRWVFIQNDNENTNVLSYEAKLYSISVTGVTGGNAPYCRKCLAGSMVSEDRSMCVKCPVGHFSRDGTDCKKCPPNHFQDEVGKSKCIPCGANTKANADATGCLINDCKFTAAPGIMYDLMPLAKVGGAMTKVEQSSVVSSRPWYHKYYYVNLCTVDHDNSSCTDLKSRRTESGRYVRESVILKTMACKRWSLSSKYSYSLGRVIGFKKMENIQEGLTVELTDGYNCFNRFTQKMQSAITIIKMYCDVNAGYGTPMPVKNASSVEVESCVFHLEWNSLYACPVCKHVEFKEVHTDCINGLKNISYIPVGYCRNSTAAAEKYDRKNVACNSIREKSWMNKKVSHTGLVVIVVVFILVAIGLIITVIMLLRKNRMYRAQLYSPGIRHMKPMKDEDDLHELIDD